MEPADSRCRTGRGIYGHLLSPGTERERIAMNDRGRLKVLGVVAGMAATVWVASFGAGVSAHDGHRRKNAPASAKKLKNPLITTDENVATCPR